MKVGINTLSVTPSRGGGKTYLLNLVKYLARIDKRNIYYLFVSPINWFLFKNLVGSNFNLVVLPLVVDNSLLKVLIEQLLLPFYLKRYNIDIMFCPNNIGIFLSLSKLIIVIHDMHYINIPEHLSKIKVSYYKIFLPISVKKSNKVIVPSFVTKNDLCKVVKGSFDKIKVIYEGANTQLDSNLKSNSLEKIKINYPFILFVSTLFKYKNVDKLIKAFAILKKRYRVPQKLVIIGRDPQKEIYHLKNLAINLGVSQYIYFLGRVNDVFLYYKLSDVFVYPSSAEGFGLPLLEAMTCGTPVIASNRTSIPEIVGDAGLIVDPDNIEELAEAIWKVLTDKKLRENLIKKGYERIKQFSWEKTAKETLKVFEEVYYENIT